MIDPRVRRARSMSVMTLPRRAPDSRPAAAWLCPFLAIFRALLDLHSPSHAAPEPQEPLAFVLNRSGS